MSATVWAAGWVGVRTTGWFAVLSLLDRALGTMMCLIAGCASTLPTPRDMLWIVCTALLTTNATRADVAASD